MPSPSNPGPNTRACKKFTVTGINSPVSVRKASCSARRNKRSGGEALHGSVIFVNTFAHCAISEFCNRSITATSRAGCTACSACRCSPPCWALSKSSRAARRSGSVVAAIICDGWRHRHVAVPLQRELPAHLAGSAGRVRQQRAADTASWIAETRLEVDTDTTSLGRSGKRSCCRTGGFVDPAAAMAGLTSSSVRR
jgi:hypothetical protein